MNILEVEFTKDPDAVRHKMYSTFTSRFPIVVKVKPKYINDRVMLEIIKKSFKLNLFAKGKNQHITGVIKEIYKNSSGDIGLMIYEIQSIKDSLTYYLGFKTEEKKKEVLNLLSTVDTFKQVAFEPIKKDSETLNLFDK